MTTFYFFGGNFQHHQLIFSLQKILHIESIIVKHNQYGKTNDEIKKLDNSSEMEKQAKELLSHT